MRTIDQEVYINTGQLHNLHTEFTFQIDLFFKEIHIFPCRPFNSKFRENQLQQQS